MRDADGAVGLVEPPCSPQSGFPLATPPERPIASALARAIREVQLDPPIKAANPKAFETRHEKPAHRWPNAID